jgi:hypothetical protein
VRKRRAAGPKHHYVVPFRRLPEDWGPLWREFFEGRSNRLLEELILAMVDNAGARRDGRRVQKALNLLNLFWRHEARALRLAREALGYPTYPVPQRERDLLFLRRRFLAQPRPAGPSGSTSDSTWGHRKV